MRNALRDPMGDTPVHNTIKISKPCNTTHLRTIPVPLEGTRFDSIRLMVCKEYTTSVLIVRPALGHHSVSQIHANFVRNSYKPFGTYRRLISETRL